MPAKIRIMVADDMEIHSEGVQRILEREPDMEVVGEVQTLSEVVARAEELQPNVLVLDLHWRYGGERLTEVTHQLMSRCPRTAIVGLTGWDDQIAAGYEAGLRWVYKKEVSGRELVEAVRRAYANPPR